MTVRQRIDTALTHLRDGLNPFVAAQMKAAYRHSWLARAKESLRDGGFSTDRNGNPSFDITSLSNILLDQWQHVFGRVLGKSEQRTVHRIRDARNDFAHQQEITLDRAIGTFEDIESLLNAVGAGANAVAVQRLKEETGRERYGAVPKLLEAPVEAKALTPWRDVVVPHADVRSRSFTSVEFAANLFDVWQRTQAEQNVTGDEYADPREFFARTFLTSGLKRLLRNAAQRLCGRGGEPVVELQTSFGGGKTHALLALYHLASGQALSELAGIEEVLKDDGIRELPGVRRVVLVGTQMQAGRVEPKQDGTRVRTLWGELAYQLGGPEGYAIVAGADETSTNPGATLGELLRRYAPCVVLIDEWVAYARQLSEDTTLDGGTFETQFTFAQALSEAVGATPGAMLVFTLPMSEDREEANDIEVGGSRGRDALRKLRHVVARTQANWQPAEAAESYAIVRRRLFEPLAEHEAKVRDRVVAAIHKYYREKEASFPKYATDPSYRQRLEECYPIHPELFERLYNEWGSLERFQRTRGVLRLMAEAIYCLWEGDDKNPMITPGIFPLDDPRVKSDLTGYLGNQNQWDSVLSRDVLGKDSVAARIDANDGRLGKVSAAKRSARAIFLATAPQHAEGAAQERGAIDIRAIKLGCVFPGEQLGAFDDAVRRLKDEGTHVNSDDSRYWFGLAPNLNRRVADLAAQYEQEPHLVDEEIERRLREWQRERGSFVRVHAPVQIAADVPDEPVARLAILGPQVAHRRKSESSDARGRASEIVAKCGVSDRRYKNCVVFLVADAVRLEELRAAVRFSLAWNKILQSQAQELTGAQQGEARKRRDDYDTEVDRLLRATWVYGLVPEQAAAIGAPIELAELRAEGGDWPAVTLSRKLESEGRLITGFGGANLRLELDRKGLWRDRDHIALHELYEYFAQYPYLSRLKDESVLRNSVQGGIASLAWEAEAFAYADGYSETTGTYLGLVAGNAATVQVDMVRGLIVRPEVAAAQFARAAAAALAISTQEAAGGVASATTTDGDGVTAVQKDPSAGKPPPRHFFQRVTVSDPRLIVKVAGQLANDIVFPLTQKRAHAEVSIEVSAQVEDGIDAALEGRLRDAADAHGLPPPELD